MQVLALAALAVGVWALGSNELPEDEFPPNGVPYVSSDDKQVYPEYTERDLLTWNNLVSVQPPSTSCWALSCPNKTLNS